MIEKVYKQICTWLADAEIAKLIHGQIHPTNFVLFDDVRFEFENMATDEEVKSSTGIAIPNEKDEEVDHASDM